MNEAQVSQLIPVEQVERLIHLARGEKVLLDADLAMLYGVTTGALNRAVKRNATRFPSDFMFQLTAEEAGILRCQIGISSPGHGGRRRSLPYAFTEQGVAMLSSVLRSERAVQVNVAIMRAFVSLRRMLAGNDALARKLAELERRIVGHDEAIRSLFDAIRELTTPPEKPRREIGFHVKEESVPYRVKRGGQGSSLLGRFATYSSHRVFRVFRGSLRLKSSRSRTSGTSRHQNTIHLDWTGRH